MRTKASNVIDLSSEGVTRIWTCNGNVPSWQKVERNTELELDYTEVTELANRIIKTTF